VNFILFKTHKEDKLEVSLRRFFKCKTSKSWII